LGLKEGRNGGFNWEGRFPPIPNFFQGSYWLGGFPKRLASRGTTYSRPGVFSAFEGVWELDLERVVKS